MRSGFHNLSCPPTFGPATPPARRGAVAIGAGVQDPKFPEWRYRCRMPRRSAAPIACLMLAPMVVWLLAELRGATPEPTVVCAPEPAKSSVRVPSVMFVEAGVVRVECAASGCGHPQGPWQVDTLRREVWQAAAVGRPVAVVGPGLQVEPCVGELHGFRWAVTIPEGVGDDIEGLLDAAEDNPSPVQAELQQLATTYRPELLAEPPAACTGARWLREVTSMSKRSGRSTASDIPQVSLHGHTVVQQWEVGENVVEAVVVDATGTLRHVRRRGRATEVVASSSPPVDEPCTQ